MSSPTRAGLRVGLSLLALIPMAACGGSSAGTVRDPGGSAGQAGLPGAEMTGGAGGAATDVDAAAPGGAGGAVGGAAGGLVPPAGAGGAAGSGAAGTGVAGSGAAGSGAAGIGAAGSGGAPASRVSPLLGDVAFSAPSQSFQGSLTVSMSTAIPGAQILYTTDGALPTAASAAYDGTPLSITATTQLRAQPFVAAAAAGTVSTAIYLARTFSLSSAMPIVLLDDYGQGPSADKDTYLDLAVMIYEPVNGTASLDDLPTVATRAAFHLHGQSSANFPQKSYKVELRDNTDDDSKYSVLGMPADSDWDFIAPYYDRSLLRNPFVYSLARDMGRQAPRVQYAEVYVATGAAPIASSDYQGIYWITETLKINGHRVNLAKLDASDTAPPDVTGGYIVEFNWQATDATKPQVTCTKPADAPASYACFSACEVTDPSPLPAASEQLAYITQYIQSFHDTLFASPIGDYGQYADVGSFADDLIINELARNIDSYRRSSYYFKDRNGLLNGGPYWDYNFALGIGNATSISPTPVARSNGTTDPGWEYQINATSRQGNVNSWFPILMTDPAFVDQVTARWTALRADLLSEAALEQRIQALAAQLSPDALARDAARWPLNTVYGTQTGMTGSIAWVKSAGSIPIYGPSASTWAGQVQALQDFVLGRADWIDSQW